MCAKHHRKHSQLPGDAASSRVLSQGGGASSSATMTRRDAASPCVARPLDDLLDKQPAVVEARVRRLGRDLLHAASDVVVAVATQLSPQSNSISVHYCLLLCQGFLHHLLQSCHALTCFVRPTFGLYIAHEADCLSTIHSNANVITLVYKESRGTCQHTSLAVSNR